MDDILKRKCIEHLVNQGLAESKTLLESIGVEFVPPDEIDKKIMLDRMCDVCVSTGEEISLCEEFLNCDVYKTYIESVKNMTGVILDYMKETMETAGVVH